MRKSILAVAVLILSASLFLTFGAGNAVAQGPAGAGAAGAAQGSSSSSSSSNSSHSLNPIKWVKKNKSTADAGANRGDLENNLTPKLQAEGVLAQNTNTTDTCAAFVNLNDCLS